jgi:2'-5' RNA ligase
MRPTDPNWFIALTVEPGEWYGPLLRTIPRHIRAFNSADLHITVAFLRDCGEQRARAAWDAVEPYFDRPLDFTIGGVEALGNRWRPSALGFASAVPDDEVSEFIGKVRDLATFKADVEPDTRPPRPHVTVIRPPKRGSLDEIREILEWAGATAPLGLPVRLTTLALYTRSVERGRQFRTVVEKTLAASD